MDRITWHLRQLLPLRYESTYTEDGDRWLCVWRMWLGRSFAVRRWRLHEEVDHA